MAAHRIAIIAPSGARLSPERFERGLARLRALGHELRCDVPAAGWQRFSAPDDERLAQIERAAGRRDVDAVMIMRGGYGLSRLLDRIDWAQVAASAAAGVRWIGYSDFTAFQLALLARTGTGSFAGPAVSGDFGGAGPDAFMLEYFEALLRGQLLPVRWSADVSTSNAPPSGALPSDVPSSNALSLGVPLADAPSAGSPPVETLTTGTLPAGPVEGVLWGGNLSLIAAAVGTPYLPRLEDGILFFEEVGEHPYRIERMLYQLLHAGVLEAQRAIVLGACTEWKPAPHDGGYGLEAVVEQFRRRIAVPILTGLPFGHVSRKAVLGVGTRYRLHEDRGDWLLTPLVGDLRSARES